MLMMRRRMMMVIINIHYSTSSSLIRVTHACDLVQFLLTFIHPLFAIPWWGGELFKKLNYFQGISKLIDKVQLLLMLLKEMISSLQFTVPRIIYTPCAFWIKKYIKKCALAARDMVDPLSPPNRLLLPTTNSTIHELIKILNARILQALQLYQGVKSFQHNDVSFCVGILV